MDNLFQTSASHFSI